MHFVLNS